jgi:hypothetical protein
MNAVRLLEGMQMILEACLAESTGPRFRADDWEVVKDLPDSPPMIAAFGRIDSRAEDVELGGPDFGDFGWVQVMAVVDVDDPAVRQRAAEAEQVMGGLMLFAAEE